MRHKLIALTLAVAVSASACGPLDAAAEDPLGTSVYVIDAWLVHDGVLDPMARVSGQTQ